MTALLPPAPFPGMLLQRAAVFWVGIRLVALVMFTFLGVPPTEAALSVLLPAVTVVAAALEARRRHETIFLANLGVSPAVVPLLSAIPAVLAETVIRILIHRYP